MRESRSLAESFSRLQLQKLFTVQTNKQVAEVCHIIECRSLNPFFRLLYYIVKEKDLISLFALSLIERVIFYFTQSLVFPLIEGPFVKLIEFFILSAVL